jgi:hypothetical protein
MRQPLPTLPVPLRVPDPDVLIDLGAVFATAYRRGRYEGDIDYTSPPPVSLRPEQREWVAAQLQTARPGTA